MTTFPKISIVTPSFNQGKFIEKTILSVIEQDYPNFEYIIIDGGSTDESVEIIKKYEQHLAYWVSEPDRGQSHAINKGFERATGEIFGWLNSDDWYLPGALKAVVEAFAANPDAGAVVGAGIYMDDLGGIISQGVPKAVSLETLNRWFQNSFWQPSSFFTRTVWKESGPLDESLQLGMDYDLWLRIAKRFNFVTVFQNLSVTLLHSDSKTFKNSHEADLLTLKLVLKYGGESALDEIIDSYAMRLADFDENANRVINEKQHEIEHLSEQLAVFENNRRDLLNSLSWRITAPLRRLVDISIAMKANCLTYISDAPIYIKGSLKLIREEGLSVIVRKLQAIAQNKPTPAVVYSQQTELIAIDLPCYEKPVVSIVIPVFNKSMFTYNCLFSIVEQAEDIPFEVIVVDNASTDNTSEILALVQNIIVVRNDENLGFVDACNIGAASAKGQYVLFLNNDTIVTPSWLSPLCQVLDGRQECGAVGSKLIYPDSRLQEAGGIIWKNATGCNFGKLDDPEKYEYNYLREVDYCSGAALMVRKVLFDKIGGFDRRYAPAYWEDTDLCFMVRRLGYKVIYQPLSVVVHFEGITAGTDVGSGMKRFQSINTPKFVAKWAGEMRGQYENSPLNLFLARDRNKGRKILVIDHYVPTHDKDAGSFFMYSLLKALVELGYRVVFWPENLFRSEPYTTELQQIGVEVVYGSNQFESYMKEYGRYFDGAVLTRNHIAINYIDTIRKYISRVLYHDPDFEYIREKRRIEIEGGTEEYLKQIKDREFYLFGNSKVITTVNPDEADIIKSEFRDKSIVTIPHPISRITDMKTPFKERSDLLFVGSSHPPNADAVLFYANEIMPLVHRVIPGIKLYIVGGNPDKKIRDLDPKYFIVKGFVDELQPYFEHCRVFVAPLRYGAGVKGKVIEAMSYGLPVVTTSIGAEGLGAVNNEQMLISDSKEGIADYIVKIYNDLNLWTNLSSASKYHAKIHYSLSAFKNKTTEAMTELFR